MLLNLYQKTHYFEIEKYEEKVAFLVFNNLIKERVKTRLKPLLDIHFIFVLITKIFFVFLIVLKGSKTTSSLHSCSIDSQVFNQVPEQLHFTGTAPKSPENDFIRDVKNSTSFSDWR